jgi:hypothetical protein
MGNLNENFYVHDDGTVEIYIGNLPKDHQTILISPDIIGKMNQAISKTLYNIVEEGDKEITDLLKEAKELEQEELREEIKQELLMEQADTDEKWEELKAREDIDNGRN